MKFNPSARSFSPVGSDDASSVRMATLTKNFDKALDIYADVIQNAEFPEKEVETYRKRLFVGLLAAPRQSERDCQSRLQQNSYTARIIRMAWR